MTLALACLAAFVAAFVAAIIQRITGLGFVLVLVLVGPVVLLYGPSRASRSACCWRSSRR